MANVVGEKRPTELCRGRKHGSVVGTEELRMLKLDRFDVPPGPTKLNSDLRVEHLVEENLQWRSACWRRSHNWRARSASSRVRAMSPSISAWYSAK